MSAKGNKAIVRRLLHGAYNERDLAVGDELLADDWVFHAFPEAIIGIGGWKTCAAAFLTAFSDDLRVTNEVSDEWGAA